MPAPRHLLTATATALAVLAITTGMQAISATAGEPSPTAYGDPAAGDPTTGAGDPAATPTASGGRAAAPARLAGSVPAAADDLSTPGKITPA